MFASRVHAAVASAVRSLSGPPERSSIPGDLPQAPGHAEPIARAPGVMRPRSATTVRPWPGRFNYPEGWRCANRV
jgi:hypothetical protein